MLNFKNKNLIIVGLLIVCGILAAGLIYTQFFSKKVAPQAEEDIISKTEATDLALVYINENLLPEGVEATLIGEVSEEWGLYKFKIRIGQEEISSYITKDGKILFPQGIDLEASLTAPPATQETQPEKTVGNFSISEDEICLEEGKPIVYFFGSEDCPHCRWEHPIIEEVAGKFTGFISFHNNMDTNADMDVFGKYSTGGIPTLVLGCKYYRVGSGEPLGQEKEAEVLTSLFCDLTENQPTQVCQ